MRIDILDKKNKFCDEDMLKSDNGKITLGKLFCLLLETNRFNSAKCTIWDDSKALYADKTVHIKGYITSGKLVEVANCKHLYTRNVEGLSIKGLFKHRIDITISCK